MMARMLVGTAMLLALGGLQETAAQADRDSVEQRALRSFHGADLEGKDGPLSRADLSLLRLYHQYRLQGRTGPLEPSSGMQVNRGSVVVDATARAQPERLVDDLRGLGAADVASAGRVVSGRLPVEAIAEAAQLSSLQSLRASRVQTNRPAPGADPAPRVSADTADTTRAASAPDDAESASGLSMSFIIGAIVFVFIGGAAFAVYMQRTGMPRSDAP